MMRKARLATTITKDGEVTFENFVHGVSDAYWGNAVNMWDGQHDDSDDSYWVYVEVEYDDEDI